MKNTVYRIKDNGVTVAVHYCATDAVREYRSRCYACKDHSRKICWEEVPNNGYVYADFFDKAHIVSANGSEIVFPLSENEEIAYGRHTGYNSKLALEKIAYLVLHAEECNATWQSEWSKRYKGAYNVKSVANAAEKFFNTYNFSKAAIEELASMYNCTMCIYNLTKDDKE